MFKTSFAAAALVALAAARGDDTGVGYDNAKTITFDTGDADDWGLTMHMYNSQATDGTNEIHGDVDLSITDGSYRVVYGFCIAPATDPAFWDCLAIRADISPEGYESSINQRSYVFQDMYLPADYDFSAGILSANADTSWSTSEASENWKVTPQRQEKSCAPGSVPDTTTCTKARGHFYRHFDTTAVDQDLQLSLSQAGDDYQVVGFYQEYAAGEDWSDNLIGEKGFVQTYTFTPEVAEGETATPEQKPYLVTPVMAAFGTAITDAKLAAEQIRQYASDADDKVRRVKDSVKDIEISKNEANAAAFDAESAASALKLETLLDDAKNAETDAKAEYEAVLISALGSATDSQRFAKELEETAQFNAASKTQAESDLADLQEDIEAGEADKAKADDLLTQFQAPIDSIAALYAEKKAADDAHDAAHASGEHSHDDEHKDDDDDHMDDHGHDHDHGHSHSHGDDHSHGDEGSVNNSDGNEKEGGAPSVTTFAAATLAAVYALTF